MNNPKNYLFKGAKYCAAEKLSFALLGLGEKPLYYERLTYQGYSEETFEHLFDNNGEALWLSDDSINTDKANDNSFDVVFLNSQNI